MIKMMSYAARISGCHYRTMFSQKSALSTRQDIQTALNITTDAGLCIGLSLVWLEYQVYRPNTDFFRKLYDQYHSAVFLKAAGISFIEHRKAYPSVNSQWIHEDAISVLLPFCGFKLPVRRDSLAFGLTSHDWEMCTEYMQSGWEKKDSLLPRYFLLIPQSVHAIAVCVKEDGSFHFFDPNAGVVIAPNAQAMQTFLKIHMNYLYQEICKKRPRAIKLTNVFRLEVNNVLHTK